MMRALPLLLLTVCLLSCGDQDRSSVSGPVVPMAAFKVALQVPDSLSASVSRVAYEISAVDMDTLRGELVFGTDGVGRVSIANVPAGPSRMINLMAYDAVGQLTFQGSATHNLVPGQTLAARIVLQPGEPEPEP
ncbi:MAG: hypothetical protein HN712_23110, partial [Gemmatimonadetes bacterium]|nr:hypothetical protein [Gemmatimonadota bacterium]